MKLIHFFLLLGIAFLGISTTLNAQNWERLYTPGDAQDFVQTPDGGFLMAGEYGVWEAADKAIITKTNAQGDVDWSRRYAIGDTLETYNQLLIMDNQHILAVGSYMLDFSQRFTTFLHQLDASGNLVKEVKLPTPSQYQDYVPSDVVRTAQGLFWVSVKEYYGGVGTDIHVVDQNLDISATYSFAGITIDQMIPAADGTMLLCGTKNYTMYLCNVDLNGNLLWEKEYESGSACMTLTQDGNIVLATTGRMIKVDLLGNIIWSKNSIPGYWQNPAWITEDQQGNLLVIGAYNANFTLAFSVGKFDAAGTLIWTKTPHQSLQGVTSYVKPLVTTSGNYAFAGSRSGKMMLLHSDTDFEVYRSWITGSMYHDLNDNCTKDIDEKSQQYFSATITDIYGTEWTESIQDGVYAMQVPSGTYTVQVNKRSLDPENWEACNTSTAVVTATTDTVKISPIGMQSLVDCPRPHLRAGIAKMRVCANNQYNLNYYNLGTQKATDVQIEVELPDFVSYIGSSLPLVTQNGQKLTFSVGDLDIDQFGSATIDVFCSCDAVLGDYACSTFRITPDTCYPTLTNWDHSIIKMEAAYDINNVSVSIENIGTGNMASPKKWQFRTFCTGFLDSGTFQLDAGASTTLTYPNNTLAYLFEAENADNQPYIPGNALMIWKSSNQPIQESWWHTTSGSPFYALNCEEVVNSFDPNDITVSPRGDGEEHYILATEPALNYRIRFQNTGNDTAFVVSIQDTLPSYLQVASVVPGPSSHPYTFDIQQNMIRFTFNNINLPDSTSNPEGSQGYVTFEVKMKEDLPVGTRINNRAAIYFDFNTPIITNTAFNIIHEPVMVSATIDQAQPTDVAVMPNPTSDYALFQFKNTFDGQFYLVDVGGRSVKTQSFSGNDFQLDCRDMAPGVYFFNIMLHGQANPVRGKLVITK